MNKFKKNAALLSLFFSSSFSLQATLIHEHPLDLDQEHIVEQRNMLQQKGLALYVKKLEALDQDPLLSTLDPSYDRDMLSLMKEILKNYDDGEKSQASGTLKKTWAKNSLQNLVISAGLLGQSFVSEYDNQEEYFKGGNFWRDLKFLYHFFQNNQINQGVVVSNAQIKKIMGSPSFKKLICEGKIVPQNHLLDLYPFISHMREKYVLKQAIDCIERARVLSFNQPYHQSVLLRAFAVLGEACTQKNLSPYTKKKFTKTPNWSKLIGIRDMIAHPEYFDQDGAILKTYKRLDSYFRKNNGASSPEFYHLIIELDTIKNALQEIQEFLSSSSFENPKIRDAHYFYKGPLSSSNGSSALLDTFYGALRLDNYETNYGKFSLKNHERSPLSLEMKIKKEVTFLKDIFDIPGKEALKDPFPETNKNVPQDVLERRAVLLKSLSENPVRIDAALYHLGRIEKFLRRDLGQANPLQSRILQEYHAFRNFIQHGNDMVDSSGITTDLLIRYTHTLFYQIMPALKISL